MRKGLIICLLCLSIMYCVPPFREWAWPLFWAIVWTLIARRLARSKKDWEFIAWLLAFPKASEDTLQRWHWSPRPRTMLRIGYGIALLTYISLGLRLYAYLRPAPEIQPLFNGGGLPYHGVAQPVPTYSPVPGVAPQAPPLEGWWSATRPYTYSENAGSTATMANPGPLSASPAASSPHHPGLFCPAVSQPAPAYSPAQKATSQASAPGEWLPGARPYVYADRVGASVATANPSTLPVPSAAPLPYCLGR
jgi:hypothetical protein